ncbi:cyanoexosortase A [Microcoleus sp. FACHB-831]|jgi:cyanoexosortase A|uniref:cyanoexosortase A n=1 Tax=Microcoleus sp. FACHB-831 TaxID=2692827 RepID=UPI00168A1D58|nr:cyanoexosortase A [Microcoleus sp. FACHB-831]MBD1923690.1 cyanoexosortase A [Microcoleus sp. FACHB-831]
MNWLKRIEDPKVWLEDPKFWLVGIAAALIALHLNLIGRAENIDLLSTSFLFWGAAATLVWDKREELKLESGVFSSFFGASLLAFLVLKSVFISGYDPFLRLSPFISAFSLALLASGVRGLKQYWQSLLILGFIAFPPTLLLRIIDLNLLTAKFAGFILWYAGFQVNRQGIILSLPNGSVEVLAGCSGVTSLFQVLGIAMIFLLMFPTNWIQKIACLIVAPLLSFMVNGVRVALMAVLVSFSNMEAFTYWHTGNGSLIFSTIAVLLFGVFCRFAILRDEPENQDPGKC